MTKLTKRQTEVLQLIKHHVDETGYPPTRAEIAQALGFKSHNAAEEHLKALARKGAIEIIPGTSRGIRIPQKQSGLPIVGKVAAGSPVLAVENIEEYWPGPANLFSPKADYFLTVQGSSMKNIGIYDGDLLAVHKCDTAQSGQVVVARVNDEVTVKRLNTQTRAPNLIELIAENESFPSIQVNLESSNFSIEGLAVGVVRASL